MPTIHLPEMTLDSSSPLPAARVRLVLCAIKAVVCGFQPYDVDASRSCAPQCITVSVPGISRRFHLKSSIVPLLLCKAMHHINQMWGTAF